MMVVQVRLVHADGHQRVVQAQAFEGDRFLASALGEATSAELAEDRARDRLRQRLQGGDGDPSPPGGLPTGAAPPRESPPPLESLRTQEAPPALEATAAQAPPATLQSTAALGSPPALEATATEEMPAPPASPPRGGGETGEPPADPEDWSADLAQLDRLLAALGWGREDERIYLQRLFGHPGRSRLTRHADLMALRRALQALPPGSRPDTAPLPLLRVDLLSQCDALLSRLGWPTDRARQCLERHFAVNSRQLLSDDQLLAFNLLLEGELLERSNPGEGMVV